jgi:hypothetical protein
MSFSSQESSATCAAELGLDISEYICVGDESFWDFHSFTLRIWDEKQKLFYSIQRSYAAFCEFHVKLTKKFIRSKLPSLPLADVGRYMKRYEKSAKRELVKRKDTLEVVSQKKALLTTYLQELLTFPEVVMSEEFAIFCDEESVDGLILSAGEVTDVDVSLKGEEACEKTVSRSFEKTFEAEEGQVVVW